MLACIVKLRLDSFGYTLVGRKEEMDKPESRTDQALGYVLAWLLSIAFGTLIKLAFDVFVALVWPRLTAFFHVWWLTFFGTIVVLLIGLVLFKFKKRFQRLYGLTEIGFALAVAWSSIFRAQSTADTTSWVAVLAAAYLIVRGLGNYDEGRRRPASI